MVVTMGLLAIGLTVSGCSQQMSGQADAGWITLFDGSNLDNWNPIGNANWRLIDGVVQADKGTGHLVSKNSYTDFQIRAEFWVDSDANSGIFIRCADPQNATLNGTRTAEGQDSKYASGRIALQSSAGVVKFRKVQIKPL